MTIQKIPVEKHFMKGNGCKMIFRLDKMYYNDWFKLYTLHELN